jgi:hypothetical protein
MSDTDTPPAETTTDEAPAGTPEAEEQAKPDPEPGTDWKAEARKWEARAKQSQTAATKAEARAGEAESSAARLQREVTRLTAAVEHGITGEYAELVQGDDDAAIRRSAKKVAALIAAQEPAGDLRVPGEGRIPAAALNSDGLTEALKTALGIR